MSGTMETTGELSWLLDDLVSRVHRIRHAVVLSGDGLAVGTSAELSREDGERFAAIASGFHSLAKGAGSHFRAGSVVQTVVELEGGFLFVVSAGESSSLSVYTDADADVGLVAYEMARLVTRVAEHLAVPSRAGFPEPSRE
ncbi:roadblock/LC7 domain-containing protein [Streptomyces meridianus]|uniref:Roadblock/LC7 domain-containing protein n=1 Tax=Streptomyces meridianus TaxID=2938945 RepID=A0ABT0X507_9ACTN|nr:roadblock/LC7 domain-containing protein [Streptomyces meridianus]MCM2577613.1 roadblock/LC7 domain-containing protein [Streptomyces meridianus]